MENAYSSALLEVEASRALLRLRQVGTYDDEGVATAFERLRETLEGIDLAPLSEEVLRRAAGPLPVALRTLDALHLATAQVWAGELREPLAFLTHDQDLERAARALGFRTAL